jgi:hypothetical protein
MTQYVLQIEDITQRLIKSYEVTPEYPVRAIVPEERTQAVITNTEQFNGAVEAYNQYKGNAHYSWDGVNITWVIV